MPNTEPRGRAEALILPILLAAPGARLTALGAGASSTVWRLDVPSGSHVVKVARPGFEATLRSEGRRLVLTASTVLPQAQDAGRLPEHPSAPPDYGACVGCDYLLLSFAPGRPLDEVWADVEPERLARAVARDVGRALADLHAVGVAHGDVKPSNVIVDLSGAQPRCHLIDLGLASSVDAGVLGGGTPRYLPPEINTTQPLDPRARDLWALGATLLEVLDPDARTLGALQDYTTQLPLPPWVKPLLNPDPAARPRAQWVAQLAGAAAERGELPIRRAYLATRARELAAVAPGVEVRLEVDGLTENWLRSACRVLQSIGDPAPDTHSLLVLGSLDEPGRRDWLRRLLGAQAADLPRTSQHTDGELALRLCRASERGPLEVVSSSLFQDAPEATEAPAHDLYELALRLGSEAPDAGTLEAAEHACLNQSELPVTLRLATARALKRRGEFARALALLDEQPMLGCRIERAAVFARMGRLERAAQELDALLGATLPERERWDALALLARVHLHRGNPFEAERLLSGAPSVPALLESRASVALTLGNFSAAAELLDSASSTCRGAEQLARVEALKANLAQQLGESSKALDCFTRAAEHAKRVGALLEDATYNVGVAGTALELGQVARALAAATRAVLLLDHLERPDAAARAELCRASALQIVGAGEEARAASEAALRRAATANDARCAGFCELVLTDLGGADGARHLAAAAHWLNPPRPDDRLRLAARELELGSEPSDIEAMDALANAASPTEVRLEWWGARAARLVLAQDTGRAAVVLEALAELRSCETPVEPKGRALASGARLAALVGDGERARTFTELAAQAFEQLHQTTPDELRAALRGRSWVRGLALTPAGRQLSGEQLRDLAHIVGALAERDRLRPLLTRVVDALVLWTGVERGLLLLKAPNGQLVPRAARHLSGRDLTDDQRKLSTSLAQRALTSGECVVAIDASGELPAFHQSVHALKLRSVLAVPLRARGESVGVVYLDDRVRRGAFGRAELSWVELVASLAALSIVETRDQLLLRRAVRRAYRAEARAEVALSKTRSALERTAEELERHRPQRAPGRHPNIVGVSPEIDTLLALIDRVADSDVPVLIRGESGSGKELVARALHDASRRRARAFVAENCSAIPETLLESTLFGHMRGAFTGATQTRAGLFELADGGTLFLDEIADMSLAMQAKLLRVLESGEVRKIGSERATRINVRVVGASHGSLEELAARGSFRADLLYRLNVITLQIPPLRERVSDIPLLVKHFLAKYGGENPPKVDDEALSTLCGFPWPGNVRQLENEVRRAIVLCDGVIRSRHLSPALVASPVAAPVSQNLRQRLDALEIELIGEALQAAAGNQTKAAQALGISRFGLQKMLKRLGLSAHTGQDGQQAVTDA